MKGKLSDIIGNIKMLSGNLADEFMSASLKARVIRLSVIGCVVVGLCIAALVSIGSDNKDVMSNVVEGSHIVENKNTEAPGKAEESAAPVATTSANPSATAAGSKSASANVSGSNANAAAGSKSASANVSGSNANAAAGSKSSSANVSGSSTNTATVLTGQSNIAANAASSGGTDVVEYQERNEYQLQEYENEVVHEDERRIIATSAAVCDIMDRLGIELVGVPETPVSSVASRYNGAARVGSPMEPDMEIIKQLNPTDVIGPDTLQADLQMKYDNIGVNSTFINLRSVEGLYDSVRILGHKYEKQAEADAVIAEYNEFMSYYSSGHEGEEKPRVLVLMGLPGSYLVATQNSYAGSLVELAGGVNVFHDDSKDFISVNTEAILATDPDVIIRTAHGLPEEAIQMFNREFSQNDIWKHFRAVKEGRVYDVDYMLFGMSATFDYPQALADLEPMLYGN